MTNNGGSCGSNAGPTAKRVIGVVIAKITTPSSPYHRPRVSCAVLLWLWLRVETGIEGVFINFSLAQGQVHEQYIQGLLRSICTDHNVST